jgi:hypothetical protein
LDDLTEARGFDAGFPWVPRDMAAMVWFAMESAAAATMFTARLH